MDYVMDMDVLDGLRIIHKARQQKTEERMFKLYAGIFPKMEEKNYMSFEEFYKPKKELEDERTSTEILKDVDAIINKHRGNWGEGN